MIIENGVLTVDDNLTDRTFELRYREGRIEQRLMKPYVSAWMSWDNEGVFHTVRAWYDDVVTNA